jgi:hypothetical protein
VVRERRRSLGDRSDRRDDGRHAAAVRGARLGAAQISPRRRSSARPIAAVP